MAVLRRKDYTKIMQTIGEREEEKLLCFFKSIFCFKGVGRMVLTKIVRQFERERIQGHKILFEQGKDAKRVYLVLEGEFEISRLKHNKLSKKEVEFKTVRALNNFRKTGLDLKLNVKREIQKI